MLEEAGMAVDDILGWSCGGISGMGAMGGMPVRLAVLYRDLSRNGDRSPRCTGRVSYVGGQKTRCGVERVRVGAKSILLGRDPRRPH